MTVVTKFEGKALQAAIEGAWQKDFVAGDPCSKSNRLSPRLAALCRRINSRRRRVVDHVESEARGRTAPIAFPNAQESDEPRRQRRVGRGHDQSGRPMSDDSAAG